jgi:hypothetical protein
MLKKRVHHGACGTLELGAVVSRTDLSRYLRFADDQRVDAAYDGKEVLDGLAIVADFEVLLDRPQTDAMELREESLDGLLRCELVLVT